MKKGLTRFDTNYFIAKATCSKECICNKDNSVYKISNVLWEFNQTKLNKSRINMNELEKDELMKKQIFFILKDEIFKLGGFIRCSSQRIPLTFKEIFVDPVDGSTNIFDLCEDCWVLYNHHKGNSFAFRNLFFNDIIINCRKKNI